MESSNTLWSLGIHFVIDLEEPINSRCYSTTQNNHFLHQNTRLRGTICHHQYASRIQGAKANGQKYKNPRPPKKIKKNRLK